MRVGIAHRLPLALLVVCFAITVHETHAEAQQAGRVVIDNRTNQGATLSIWRYDGRHWEWKFVAEVSSGRWVPIYDVSQGERLRAKLGNGPELYHTVKLQHDQRTNTWQDVWWLQL